ncbi:Panacea domain-containing protein [Sphingobium boeckii]|uniref:Putative phage-associated protein n=1 Tax=Sphingobium boeckii TaxID=1082345 RepID=A0A7W9AIF5_9SPHN|nr:type II toxin-antitoxin system antitoxin SocA domain-containing protein [Sphingobium boeckii]MBB5686272.1 putative phage-associated protein [Sphingobium boeckii]
MYDVRDIANFTLDFAEEYNLPLTNLALQKLLYFAHGWFYSLFDEPLIKNKFEAWQYGPVQRVIYNQFKICGNTPIRDIRATYIDPLSGEAVYKPPLISGDHKAVIREVLQKYARYTAGQLVEESHVEDGPWEYVWKQAEEVIYPGMKIPDALILDHFKRLNPIITQH